MLPPPGVVKNIEMQYHIINTVNYAVEELGANPIISYTSDILTLHCKNAHIYETCYGLL